MPLLLQVEPYIGASMSKKIENTLGSAAETLIKFFRAEEEDIYKNMTAKEIMEHVHSHYKKTI